MCDGTNFISSVHKDCSDLCDIGADNPWIKGRPLPYLLYVDDTVLIARTANSFQILMYGFLKFMYTLELNANPTKTFYMNCGAKRAKTSALFVNGVRVERVNQFSYLGVTFDSLCTWGPVISNRCLLFSRCVGALFNFVHNLRGKPVKPLLEVFKHRCLPPLTYGGGLWGYRNLEAAQREENWFLRRLLGVPPSSSAVFIHKEVGLGYVKDHLSAASALLWLAVWSNPHAGLNRDIIQDCIACKREQKIQWLKFVSSTFEQLGRQDVYLNLEEIRKGVVAEVKFSIFVMLRTGFSHNALKNSFPQKL